MKIYHNPRCSKSRQTLEILRSHGIEPEIIEYLETPPSGDEIREILNKLGITARELARKKESGAVGVELSTASEEQIIEAMTTNPVIIERPIVVSGNKAVLGRPPENVTALI